MEKVILTGVKPTGEPHLGNYVGAIRPALKRAQENPGQSYFFVADYHSLTSLPSAKELQMLIRKVAASWLACGLDSQKTIFYLQSDIPELLELTWFLSCITPKGLMNRAHSYKAKQDQNREKGQKDLDDGVSMGLYNYPVLMAADILLFSATEVPVGGDQVQHLEMARDIAKKFNHIYKTNLFSIPQALVYEETTISGLDGRKMSKSYNNIIPLFCDSQKLRKIIMKIKTDSKDPKDPKETKDSILFDIYKNFSSKEETSHLRKLYSEGVGWGEVKEMVFEKLESYFKDKREVYNHYMEQNGELEKILKEGKGKAQSVAQDFLKKVRAVLGLS